MFNKPRHPGPHTYIYIYTYIYSLMIVYSCFAVVGAGSEAPRFFGDLARGKQTAIKVWKFGGKQNANTLFQLPCMVAR